MYDIILQKKSYFYYPKKGVEGRFLNEGRRGISPV